jgi:ribonuclease Z
MDAMLHMFFFVGDLKINIHEIDKKDFFECNKFKLEAYPLKHSTASIAYVFKEKDRLRIDKNKLKKLKLKGPIIGELQKGKDITVGSKKIKAKNMTYLQKGKKITFIMDTALVPECYDAAEDADILVSEATYTKELKEKAAEYLHLTSEQAAQIAKKSKAKELWLTHISQRYEAIPQVILNEAKKVFKNSHLAEDLMRIEL